MAIEANSSGTAELELSNPHGDLVATVPLDFSGGAGIDCTNSVNAADPSCVGPSSYSESTEFGDARGTDTDQTPYSWLGSRQRSNDTVAGIILMGDRLYDPTVARFLSSDPIPGGNANAYNYPNNPNDELDLSGDIEWPVGGACGEGGVDVTNGAQAETGSYGVGGSNDAYTQNNNELGHNDASRPSGQESVASGLDELDRAIKFAMWEHDGARNYFSLLIRRAERDIRILRRAARSDARRGFYGSYHSAKRAISRAAKILEKFQCYMNEYAYHPGQRD